jgi:hypothetical protein
VNGPGIAVACWAPVFCRERRLARLALAQAFFDAAAPAVKFVSVASPVSAIRSPSLIRPLATRLFTSTSTLPTISPNFDICAGHPSGAGDRRAKILCVLYEFWIGSEPRLCERLGESRLRRLGTRLVLHALYGTAFTELSDNQGSQTVIGVGNGLTTNLPGFSNRTSRQGPDNAGKEPNHRHT